MKTRTTFFTIRRFMALAMTLLGVVTSSWAGNFNLPEVADVNDVFAAPAVFKAGAQAPQFTLQPVTVGDVNRDGTMNITDVTDLIDALLSNNDYGLNGDVDGDGNVNISDVTDLIDRLLSGTVETRLGTGELASAMNNIYRMLRTAGWSSTGNTHQAFGILAHTLTAEVMGDDMIMAAQGSGWFWFDATYNVKSRYTSTAWRSFDLWNTYYTCIAEANSIISQKNNITGSTDLVNYYVGQAYALRAYSYFMLSQWFARTYKGHESDPCVPLFTGTVFNGSTGQPRATVTQVYSQINSDISQAVSLLQGKNQLRPDHIGYAVALGIRARIALVKEDWLTAYNSAVSAISASGKSILEVPSFVGVNNARAGNVMWGAEIPDAQSGQYAAFFTHMDVSGSMTTYAQRAPKQISTWLYDKMSATDARRAWWDPSSSYSTGGYVTQKFKMREGVIGAGDYIYMRVEEMYLTAAEAACRRGQTTSAKNYLNQLMAKRVPGYTCNKTGTSLGALTTTETGSLLEEILLQRRIELWGEDGRIYTIRRLRQGFERTAENGWPNSLLLTNRSLQDPESYPWVMTIPLAEFDGNPNMNFTNDQNPMDDYAETSATGPQNVSFVQATQEVQTPSVAQTVNVPIKRATSQGSYYARVNIHYSNDMSPNGGTSTRMVHFADGVSESVVEVTTSDMELGHDYYVDLTLSDYDVANSSPSLGSTITSTRVIVHCKNGSAAGQKISFTEPEVQHEATSSLVSIPVTLTRAITSNAYSATLILSENDEHVKLYNSRVVFDEGKNSATVYVDFSGIQEGHSCSCLLSLSPADAATGGEYTSIRITLVRLNWNTIGYVTYNSEFMGSMSVRLDQMSGTGNYRLVDLYGEGYDILLTIDNDNSIYMNPQPCFGSTYGLVYMRGYANSDESNYAGTYDPSTRLVSMLISYYVPGVGTYGTWTDEFYMP